MCSANDYMVMRSGVEGGLLAGSRWGAEVRRAASRGRAVGSACETATRSARVWFLPGGVQASGERQIGRHAWGGQFVLVEGATANEGRAPCKRRAISGKVSGTGGSGVIQSESSDGVIQPDRGVSRGGGQRTATVPSSMPRSRCPPPTESPLCPSAPYLRRYRTPVLFGSAVSAR
jgi:hypothetical protein